MRACKVVLDKDMLLQLLGFELHQDIHILHTQVRMDVWNDRRLEIVFDGYGLSEEFDTIPGEIIPEAVIEITKTVHKARFKKIE